MITGKGKVGWLTKKGRAIELSSNLCSRTRALLESSTFLWFCGASGIKLFLSMCFLALDELHYSMPCDSATVFVPCKILISPFFPRSTRV